MSERFKQYKRKLRWKSSIRKEGAGMDPSCPNCGSPMHWREGPGLGAMWPEGAWECSNQRCWHMLPPGELAPDTPPENPDTGHSDLTLPDHWAAMRKAARIASTGYTCPACLYRGDAMDEPDGALPSACPNCGITGYTMWDDDPDLINYLTDPDMKAAVQEARQHQQGGGMLQTAFDIEALPETDHPLGRQGAYAHPLGPGFGMDNCGRCGSPLGGGPSGFDPEINHAICLNCWGQQHPEGLPPHPGLYDPYREQGTPNDPHSS